MRASKISETVSDSDVTSQNHISKTPKLTIAIPTYNRCAYLRRCLRTVLDQYNDRIEILVSDNASTDSTKELIANMIEDKAPIAYFANDRNLGFDGNFLNCFSNAKGEYVLLLSDDDILVPGAIEAILDAADENPSLIHLNNCGIIHENPLITGKPRMKNTGIKRFDNATDFYAAMGIHITYISSLVFKRNLVQAADNIESYIGTSFLHSHTAMDLLSLGESFSIVTQCCIAATPNKTVSYDLYEIWGKQCKALMVEKAIASGIDASTAMRVYADSANELLLHFVASIKPKDAVWSKELMLQALEDLPAAKRLCKLLMNLPKPIAIPIAIGWSYIWRLKNLRTKACSSQAH